MTSRLGLILFRKQIDIYSENHIEIHNYTLWGKARTLFNIIVVVMCT